MFIDFKHANLRDGLTPRPVTVRADQVFTYFASADNSTMLIGPGGACIPVLEKPDEVKIKLLGAIK